MERLVRLMKLRRFLRSVYYAIESEYVSILTHILQTIALVLALCHMIGHVVSRQLCVVVFALVGFTYIVGSITGSLTQLRSLSEGSAKMFWDLRRYLTHFRVQPTLALRILRIEEYLEHAWARQQKGITRRVCCC
ncbi:unnamed protein product [Prorocentrum cordatum]|uniref:ABC transmembrane type-1 domain-containing protein n=1 Tax=Prorocentrum cordatum TaxID=2364126 RepID=A0ABN9VXZ8_9DINO|nr:unnamed protein product [Polarella glacialis]